MLEFVTFVARKRGYVLLALAVVAAIAGGEAHHICGFADGNW